MKKKIAVFFNTPGYDSYPFNDRIYVDAYHELAEIVDGLHGQLIIVRGQRSYMHDMTFSASWAYWKGHFSREDRPVKVDLIFNRSNFVCDETDTVVNHPDLEEICTDKVKTYHHFAHLSCKTAIVWKRAELAGAIESIPSPLVVAKPVDAEGGKGVFIGPKDEVHGKIKDFPYILQEFLETSGGIPGIAKGRHDFRMIGIEGEIAAANVREPKEGSYLSNVSQGGIQTFVPLANIPPEAREFFQAVDHELQRFKKRLFSVDVGRDPHGNWKLIELNSKPGMLPSSLFPEARQFLERTARLLVS